MKLRNKPFVGLAIAASGLVLAGAAQMSAQERGQERGQERATAQSGTQSSNQANTTRIGVVENARVYQAYGPAQAFNQQAQAMQQEFARAQQSGDQQKIQEIQARFNQMQTELTEKFEKDLEAASRSVAKDEKFSMIVGEVLYAPENVKEVDVTQDLIAIINGDDTQGQGGGMPSGSPMPTPDD